METFELILFLLTAVIASSILDKFLPPLSLPLVQIALGAALALAVPTPLEWGIDPELLLILFIAPLHFNESRHVDSGALWKNRWGIASLSVGLVFAIVAACGATLHALLPAVPLAAACALGGAMGSTDAVAVTALTHDRRFGRRHEALLKGEALFNDVTGTVVFQCCLTILATGSFSLLHAGEEFALDLFGGFFGGLVMGLLAWGLLQVLRRTGLDNPTLHVMLELLLPFVIYLAAKSLHIGAVIAVVASGLMLSLLPQRHTAATARTKLQAQSVWTTLEFVLNGIIFVVLGMQLPRLLEPAAEGSLGDPGDAAGRRGGADSRVGRSALRVAARHGREGCDRIGQGGAQLLRPCGPARHPCHGLRRRQGRHHALPHVDADGGRGLVRFRSGHARLHCLGHDRADPGAGRLRGAGAHALKTFGEAHPRSGGCRDRPHPGRDRLHRGRRASHRGGEGRCRRRR